MSLSARRAWIEINRRCICLLSYTVALRKESVDRNQQFRQSFQGDPVALRKESVDRNPIQRSLNCSYWTSLSARRAWIEILLRYIYNRATNVALRKESVDRNPPLQSLHQLGQAVALRKESVDRNFIACKRNVVYNRRSPQGERG